MANEDGLQGEQFAGDGAGIYSNGRSGTADSTGGDGQGLGTSPGMDEGQAEYDASPLGSPQDARRGSLGAGGGDSDDDMPMPGRLEALASQRSRSVDSSSLQYSRPGSAVINLRGSRPNSAAIAQEIEGFEDDFMERVEEEPEEEMTAEEEEEEDLGPSIEELIARAQQEQARLMEANDSLQRRARMALDFRNKGRPPVNRDLSRLDGAATRYRAALRQWIEILEERDSVESHYQTTIFDMKSTLEERIKRADDISRAYKHFRLEVAKSAEHSKTGRPISEKLLAQLETDDASKEEEVQRVRLKNIHLTNQLRRIEQTLRQKEELAEGLHLIDFEQLKIENQSLNEKIEERNEELLKLKKKTTTTVQILTHVREKLQFIEKENAALAASLADLEAELAEKRDRLGRIKAERDTLRAKGRKIKESGSNITSSQLLDDIEVQKEKREALLVSIEEAQRHYTELSESIQRTNHRIANVTEELQQAQAAASIMAPGMSQPATRSVPAPSGASGASGARSLNQRA
ncbi:hypothetical protein Agub_g2164 [Astrephomene gubernaculifera]|uniref:CCDC113/CCDC96 coiled-coil domain-containing protein n=1 Tax=Astrephomene gubernaculifera TaxID=47775 RepID=A0AAD3DGM7_9CHLO|nr:hypothetical protein Agub_g2164 [Astrephomene gubernaculifera]